MWYFTSQAQETTISRGFNLTFISGKIQDGGQDDDYCCLTLQASSSATTHKIYLILLRRSKAFH